MHRIKIRNEKWQVLEILGPPQTREIVVGNYLVVNHKKLSITKKASV